MGPQMSTAPSTRLLKKAHLLRCAPSPRSNVSVNTPPLVDFSRASHLDLFEQPVIRIFQQSFIFQIAIVLLAGSTALGAAALNRDLEGLRTKIARERKGLAEIKIKENATLRSLGKIEGELERRNRELRVANSKLLSTARELATQKLEAEELARQLAARRSGFEQRLVALYRWQRRASTLPILNPAASPGSAAQRRIYMQAALDYDREVNARLSAVNQRQEMQQQEFEEKIVQLRDHGRRLGAAQQAVHREAQKKRLFLTSLRREKDSRAQSLQAMEAAAERLARMVDQITRRAVAKAKQTPEEVPTGGGLDPLRGQLDWPLKGRITAPFGRFKHPEFAAEIIRKGIDIEAHAGEPIRAVQSGRIVYATHFAGYGNTMIIDHGERYYTIYGHLSEILKKTGDEVRRGEVLGRAGDSDSLAGSNLYFEIRKDGRSVDPLPWLRKQ